MLNHLLTVAGPSAVVALALLGIAAYVNPLLFVALLVVAILMLAFSVATRKRFRRRVAQHHAARARYSADSHEAVSGIDSARLHGSEGWARGARAPAIEELERAGKAVVRISSLDSAVQGGLAAAAGIVVLIVGGIAATHGDVSVGGLLGFYAASHSWSGRSTPSSPARSTSCRACRRCSASTGSSAFPPTRVRGQRAPRTGRRSRARGGQLLLPR